MIIRRATPDDLDQIMACYAAGRAHMRAAGNDQQWTGAYPTRDVAEADLASGNLVVAADEAGSILGCMSFIPGPDPTYAVIEGGSWIDDGPYHVVHRIAAMAQRGGVGRALMGWACDHARCVRVDTHEVNAPMRAMLESMGFSYCGVIHLEDGAPRVAYQHVS